MTIVVPDYISEPPDNLPPAVVGTLIDEKADMQDIVSTLIDLANRGYVTMTEEDSNHVFARTDKDANDLRPYEKQFLKDIFGSKEERSLNDLRYKFASKLPNLRNMVYQELVDEKLVPASPQSVRRSYGCFAGLLFAVAVASFFILTALFVETVDTIVCIPLTLGITALLMMIASRHMPKKTAKGTEAAAKWNAFKQYLKNIERYADLEQSSEIFADYLAYAVAFGLERTWIRKFSSVPTTPIPRWYYPVLWWLLWAVMAGERPPVLLVLASAPGANAPGYVGRPNRRSDRHVLRINTHVKFNFIRAQEHASQFAQRRIRRGI